MNFSPTWGDKRGENLAKIKPIFVLRFPGRVAAGNSQKSLTNSTVVLFYKGKARNLARGFPPCQTPKTLEKTGKTPQITKESLRLRINQGNPTNQGKEGQGRAESLASREFRELLREFLFGAVKGVYLKGLFAQSRLFYREMDCPVRFHREMDCPVQWSLAAPSALESQSRTNQGSVVANPICKCRRHKAGHLQVRVTSVLKEAPLNKGPLGLPHELAFRMAISIPTGKDTCALFCFKT